MWLDLNLKHGKHLDCESEAVEAFGKVGLQIAWPEGNQSVHLPFYLGLQRVLLLPVLSCSGSVSRFGFGTKI